MLATISIARRPLSALTTPELSDLVRFSGRLSPENLFADGERPRHEAIALCTQISTELNAYCAERSIDTSAAFDEDAVLAEWTSRRR
jgi:hypothetical protein